MSELNTYYIPTRSGNSCLCYLKSEADKVIADLEESHKMEVEQLLMEIVKLKAQKAQAADDCAYWKMREGNAVNAMHETEEACMFLTKSEWHQKYKRCMANAWWCKREANRIEDIAPFFETNNESWEYYSDYWGKWHKRWLEIAEKFKPNSTTQQGK